MVSTVEVVSPTQIRVGRSLLKWKQMEQPFPDGSWSFIEVSGRPDSDLQQRFYVDDFRGVIAGELPMGVDFSYGSPVPIDTKEIDWLNILHVGGKISMRIALRFYFPTWYYRSNLLHFCNALAPALQQGVEHCQSAEVIADEYGTNIDCRIHVDKAEELYGAVRKADSQIARVLREAYLAEARAPANVGTLAPVLKPDETGLKWWLRYAIVPLGGIALGIFLAKMFS